MSERPGQLPHPEAEPVEITSEPFALTEPVQDEPVEAKPRSRTRVIVLSSLLAVGLAGAAAIGYAGWQIASQKDATLTVPAQVSGLSVDNSAEGRSTADYLQTALSAEVALDEAVGAVYSDGSGKDVLFLGGTTLIWTPGSDLETAFGLVSDDQGAVTGLHDVPAGPLGGTMKCGTTKSDGADMPVCGWADHGSLALAMFPGRTQDDASKLIKEIRAAAQTRD
jgi:hypothetical protein